MKRPIPLIALLTDFGTSDPYVGIMKGAILSINPEVRIVDITHDLPSQSILGAGFHLRNCASFFPDGTLFVAVVDPGVGTKRKIVYGESGRHRFLAPDNGLLDMLGPKDGLRSTRSVTNRRYMRSEISNTFHGRDIFAPVAAWISLAVDPARLGPALPRIESAPWRPPRRQKDGSVAGQVLAVDRFGNLITDIPGSEIRDHKRSVVWIEGRKIEGISRTYEKKRLIALIGSSGTLEIAVAHRSAYAELKAGPGSPVFVHPPGFKSSRGVGGDRVWVLETNLDNISGEAVGNLFETLFSCGALDVWTTPIQMKKSRPGIQLSVMVEGGRIHMAHEILRNTPTFGVRLHEMPRLTLDREIKTVRTRYGPIRCKVGYMDKRAMRASPEYEDVAAAAREAGVSFDTVHKVATAAAGRLLKE